jgi:hypothetical protein
LEWIIPKRVYQLRWVEPATGEIVAPQLSGRNFWSISQIVQTCLICMDACGGSQHWARSLQKLGHEVKLLSGRMVKPFVVGNKNDAAEARAIWTAVQQPAIKTVAIKSEEQQAVLARSHARAGGKVPHCAAQRPEGIAHGVRRGHAAGPVSSEISLGHWNDYPIGYRRSLSQIAARVVDGINEASAEECGRRRDREQNGTYDLGADGA